MQLPYLQAAVAAAQHRSQACLACPVLSIAVETAVSGGKASCWCVCLCVIFTEDKAKGVRSHISGGRVLTELLS